MIRRFCDSCNEEITSSRECTGGTIGRLGAKLKGTSGKPALDVEVIVFKDGTSNTGDWCKYCVIDALNRYDDRPRQGSPATTDGSTT